MTKPFVNLAELHSLESTHIDGSQKEKIPFNVTSTDDKLFCFQHDQHLSFELRSRFRSAFEEVIVVFVLTSMLFRLAFCVYFLSLATRSSLFIAKLKNNVISSVPPK